MKDKFYSYLDGFNRVTIIYPKKNLKNANEKAFYVLVEDEMFALNIMDATDLGNEMKYNCSLPESLSLNIEYTVIDELQNRSLLRIGKIVRTDLFEMLYAYTKDDLGILYTKESTTFKVWSPVAKEIEIEIIAPNGKVSYFDLVSMPRGIWSIAINGDLDGYKYRYHVRVDSDFKTTLDPYAVSSDANALFNYVIDPNKLYQFKYPKPEFSGKMVDAVIYELHIRDFTIDKNINNPYAGKYLGLIENMPTKDGHPTGLEYLRELGVTHVQLQPIFDFGGVDELNPDKEYNWGYNPVQYNVPEGWFSTNPNDPYARINELRQLIDEIHHLGMRVVMDVVYNHVYEADSFPFSTLVPGYFFRYDANGMMTNVSGCGNDIASGKRMASKFIVDSCRRWLSNYNLDGFRFDLMGLLDVATMNNVHMIVKNADPSGIVYGEGWNMPAYIPEDERANMSNYTQMPSIGFFNDRFRDTLKGSQWTGHLGYAAGGTVSPLDVLYLVTGSSIDDYLFLSPNQSINYVECHDNYTFYDFVKKYAPNMDEKTIKDYARLALSLVLISQGVPFIHAGQEFFRTKKGVENSYNAKDDINQINWEQADSNYDTIGMVKDLIAIRKEYNFFRYDRKSIIKERIKLGHGDISAQSIRLSCKSVDGLFYVIIKNNYKYEYVDFKGFATIIFDGKHRSEEIRESLELTCPGVYILKEGRN